MNATLLQAVMAEHVQGHTLLVCPQHHLPQHVADKLQQANTSAPICIAQTNPSDQDKCEQEKNRIDWLAPPASMQQFTEATHETMHNQARYDLGVVYQVLEHHHKTLGEQLLARLRNLHCQRLLVLINQAENTARAGQRWHENDFFALGLQRTDTKESDDDNSSAPDTTSNTLCYTYNIKHYNRKRRWNNADNWANPENFGKYWW